MNPDSVATAAAVVDGMGFGPSRGHVQSLSRLLNEPEDSFIANEGTDIVQYFDPHFVSNNRGFKIEITTHKVPDPSGFPGRIRIHDLREKENDPQPNVLKSGTELMHAINSLADQLNYDSMVVNDTATVELNSPTPSRRVDLAALSILLNGQSFYNKLGYFGNNYHNEYPHNENRRSQTLQGFFPKRFFSDRLDEIKEAFPEKEVTEDTSILELASWLKNSLKNKQGITDEIATVVEALIGKFRMNYGTTALIRIPQSTGQKHKLTREGEV